MIAAVAAYTGGLEKLTDRAMGQVQHLAGFYSQTNMDSNELLIQAEKTSLGFIEGDSGVKQTFVIER